GSSSNAPRLTVRDKGKIDDGTAVTWVLAGESVQLLAADSSPAALTNVLQTQISELLPLGEISLCRFAVQATHDSIQLNLATSLVQSMQLQVGAAVQLAFPWDAAHIMPLR
ncbi:MAG: ABC transporter ATP-binding protein, partial [Brachymonas sp.]